MNDFLYMWRSSLCVKCLENKDKKEGKNENKEDKAIK
jgi:hypothetical protein